jgi:hypothetical protein
VQDCASLDYFMQSAAFFMQLPAFSCSASRSRSAFSMRRTSFATLLPSHSEPHSFHNRQPHASGFSSGFRGYACIAIGTQVFSATFVGMLGAAGALGLSTGCSASSLVGCTDAGNSSLASRAMART